MNRLSPNVKVFIVYGLLYDAVVNVYKPYSMKFLTRLGGDETYISLLNSLPGAVAALALLPGAVFLSGRMNGRRASNGGTSGANQLIRAFFFISRSILLIVAFIPFFPASIRPVLYVALISLMNFPDALSQTAVQASLGRFFVDGNVRATAISLRSKFGNIFMPVMTVLTGVIISVIPKDDGQIMTVYQCFFLAAFVIGLFEIKTFGKFKEDPLAVQDAAPPRKTDFNSVKNVFKNKRFTNYLASTLFFYFCWQAGWALSVIYQIQSLGANEIWLAAFAVANGVTSFLTAGFWGGRIKKYGNERTLFTASVFVAFNMFVIALAPNLYIMVLASVYSGFASVGMSIVLLNSLISATPDEDRMVYIGVYNTCVNISLGVAPMASLLLMNRVGIGVVNTMFVVGAVRMTASLGFWLRNKKLAAGADRE